jgi:AcrR family transcriptional regulator
MKDLVASAPRAAGRPRSTRAHDAIIDAVLDLLAEGTPLGELSIEAIAARAGVGKATIYRRWAGKNELLIDAVKTLKTAPPLSPGSSVRDDLVRMVNTGGTINVDPRAAQVFPCLMPEVMRNPELQVLYQQLIEPRRERTREILRRGIASGELRADLDIEITTLMITGPVLIQRWMGWNPNVDESTLPEKVIDALMIGISAQR